MMDLSPEEEYFPGRLLHQAALWDNAELLEDLLKSDTGPFLVNSVDQFGRTALHAAAVTERSRCLSILLRNGADPNLACLQQAGGMTPLHTCAERGHTDNITTLLEAGAIWSINDASGSTALVLAERASHRHAANKLRDAKDACERSRLSRHAVLREAVSSGDATSLRSLLDRFGSEAPLLVNLAPGGANTLLFIASESGYVDMVKMLLNAGADGRVHPVTRYSPLYAACHQGHTSTVNVILTHYPQLVQQETVERWLPIHAACINGHASVIKQLCRFSYPESILNTYTDESGAWQYTAAFDINHEDVDGRTPLYIASTLGNMNVLETLLEYRVKAEPVEQTKSTDTTPTAVEACPLPDPISHHEQVLSPTRRRISYGIQSIMSKLTRRSSNTDEELLESQGTMVACVRIGGSWGAACVCAAITGGHMATAERLLRAGADPNAPVILPLQQHTQKVERAVGIPRADRLLRSGRSSRVRSASAPPARRTQKPPTSYAAVPHNNQSQPSPLVLAAKVRDHRLLGILLKYGAVDSNNYAIREAAENHDEHMVETLLSVRAYPDPEHKINKKGISEWACMGSGSKAPNSSSLTYSAIFPSQPVMVNWRQLKCAMATVRIRWLRSAVLHVNDKLTNKSVALHAITRIDVSCNALQTLPLQILQLSSLKYLNAGQNKLERLPSVGDEELEPDDDAQRQSSQRQVQRHSQGGIKRTNFGRQPSTEQGCLYTCPVLEELYLQDNRLDDLPPALFRLPSLVTLDVSNNKLRQLPKEMWLAPKLRELNVALNLLRDLPESSWLLDGIIESEKDQRISSSSSTSQLSQIQQSKDISRSPSIDRSEGDADMVAVTDKGADESAIPLILTRSGYITCQEIRHQHAWLRTLEVTAEVGEICEVNTGGVKNSSCAAPQSTLSSLNLAHNQFTAVPVSLACLAPKLTRLNMAYNSLRSMSYVTSYPVSLRQLDLSHNQISCWPSLPQLECVGGAEPSPLRCYCPGGSSGSAHDSTGSSSGGARRPPSGCSLRCAVLSSVCPAKRHLRLDSLRTLILADNLLTRIQLTTDDDGWTATGPGTTNQAGGNTNANAGGSSIDSTSGNDEEDDWNLMPAVKTRLLFPSLSMLDISNNLLRGIPSNIHDLTNLSVFNISGNTEIYDLPPQMGLLSRLWNLNTAGCSLHEPLRSMIDSKKYKTMDIVGYLKSVLEDAQPYTRLKLMIVGEMGVGKTSLLGCLRRESAPAHRRRATEHWAKRMGNKNINSKTSKGVSMSTVGVDIGDWVYEKMGGGAARGTRPPIAFRTWDFGGQHEYYATHQYFLSRRSLYVVVWSPYFSSSGQCGRSPLRGVLRWLRSVQARAPGAPVLIVATHFDRVNDRKLSNGDTSETLQRLIRDRFINVPDADKCGLPRVLDTLEVSCKTGHNMRLLADIIYEAAYTMRPPGSKEPLLEQRVPATYLALEDCVSALAADRRAKHLDPVLTHDQYKIQVTQYMQHRFHRNFRDQAELHQATLFLHENGVLLHYDDATLKELYFLDPQWLCDILAHVVTVREINPFAKGGIMKLEDLKHVLRSSSLSGEGSSAESGQPDGEETRALAVSLLNKFELALCWDGRSLIVPPLLPDMHTNATKLPLRSRHWSSARSSSTGLPPLTSDSTPNNSSCVARTDASSCLRRLVLMSYVPSGFWPRLVTRMLADEQIPDVVASCYQLPEELSVDPASLDLCGSWQLWQTGLRLMYGDLVLLTVREAAPTSNYDDFLLDGCAWDGYEQADDYRNIRFRLKQDGVWCDVDMPTSAILEIQLPAEILIIKRPVDDENGHSIGYQNITVEPSPESIAKLLALSSDHVDLLLEDWYPTLGTRFVHTSEGRCLVTRLVPCPLCLRECLCACAPPIPDSSLLNNDNVQELHSRLDAVVLKGSESRSRPSLESCASDKDSGVGADSTASSRMPSVEGLRGDTRPELNLRPGSVRPLAYGWTMEECVLVACGGPHTAQVLPAFANPFSVDITDACPNVVCPTHGPTPLVTVAPDCILCDVPLSRRAYRRELTPRRLLGRGAFGSVFAADWRPQGHPSRPVALKVLQPVPPGPGASEGAVAAYKAWWGRWWREGEACAIRAHCSARQELAVLTTLSHINVLPLLAVCARPLALLLELAPMGALDSLLRLYRSRGTRTGARTARALTLQAARALEYLHARRVVYRDLKAENVLVWKLPDPSSIDDAEQASEPIPVHIKLADYGISRLTLPSGTKGFGGTEGFMAPEIMRYNGEEEYTEKVDCFSYGMYMYEVLTLRQPFEGHEAVKEAILDGGRPTLSYRDTVYPCYMLDTMSLCWSTAPELRPSASQLVSIVSAPEYSRLQDVCALGNLLDSGKGCTVAPAVSLDNIAGEGVLGWEMWWCVNGISGPPTAVDGRCHLLPTTAEGVIRHNSFKLPSAQSGDAVVTPTALCVVNTSIWIGDRDGWLHAYDLLECRCMWRCATVMAVCGTTSAGAADDSSVADLLYLSTLKKVAVAMDNGRLFLVRSTGPGTEADGDFVLTELGAATALYSLAGVNIAERWEMWCGGRSGQLWCYTVGPMGVEEARDLHHPPLLHSPLDSDGQNGQTRLTSYSSTKNVNDQYFFTYMEPGCIVYQWRPACSEVRARLDCSKLVPCSESLKSISIEEHLSPTHCQVTSICTLGEDIYVGTAWGCIIVAEAATLRPITIFRPHDNQVLALVPLISGNGMGPPMLASLGRGYRNLLARYTDSHQQGQSESSTGQTAYCLLWRTHNWVVD